ncbi:FAD-binding oxidoreductase [Bradyrhizobium septentrionale]|uniref:FAD-binding oxidoreductase n=2 Tax=Bradyrhizobium septentrionale TaxID=1404411 RepID=A0A973W2P8_9BRAD|nr:FAD-binding oxidoreductase [Bradyrhizobium septentrionale]UGY14803.1 FAD-binding oxidoreductase [Bradyrhizobium septentrionale]UGY23374.1 FAD-binding oxidoreductase [Bradyrhizobium septentrionale]
MNRRELLIGAALTPVAHWMVPRPVAAAQGASISSQMLRRTRPSDPEWPSAASWNRLNEQTEGRLMAVKSPLVACQDNPAGAACRDVFKGLKNPYYIGDDAALTQTAGYLDAWASQPSVYAVAARKTADVVAAVNFARDNNLRLVVRGGGHSYLGTSSAPDSLMIWTRAMNDITLHESFVAQGSEDPPQPAVTVGAGAIWMHVYNEVTTRGGRYVQGGGCGTVGVAGLLQGGGFGSYSKNYGTAAASLLEAEIVTADGVVRIANARSNPDLFWALRGGGGGTFGVVTRLTLRTHELPDVFGFASMTIQAASGSSFRKLVGAFVDLYADRLHDRHWGEIVNIKPGNVLDIQLSFQGLSKQQADELWQAFIRLVSEAGGEFAFTRSPSIRTGPAARRWDAAYIRQRAPQAILSDDRPGAPAENVFWAANLSEAGHFIHGFESLWLPASLLDGVERPRLVEALLAAAQHATVELHFQKGLAGGSEAAIASAKETATNPAVIDAFVLAIIASEGPPAYSGLSGHEPDLADARKNAAGIAKAVGELRKVAPDGGAYLAESSFFEPKWQQAYWGANYKRLLQIKQQYDPAGLFFVRHGVGSEGWSDDGFARLAAHQ